MKRKQRKRAKFIADAIRYDLPRRDSCQAPLLLLLPKISEGVVSAFVSTLDSHGIHGLQEAHPLKQLDYGSSLDVPKSVEPV